MRTQVFSVPDISCDVCKNAIEGALRPLPGVRLAAVDVGAGTVRVDFEDTVAPNVPVAAIEQQGFRVAAVQD